MPITRTRTLTTGTQPTANELREFLDGLTGTEKISVNLYPGDQREPGQITFRVTEPTLSKTGYSHV